MMSLLVFLMRVASLPYDPIQIDQRPIVMNQFIFNWNGKIINPSLPTGQVKTLMCCSVLLPGNLID